MSEAACNPTAETCQLVDSNARRRSAISTQTSFTEDQSFSRAASLLQATRTGQEIGSSIELDMEPTDKKLYEEYHSGATFANTPNVMHELNTFRTATASQQTSSAQHDVQELHSTIASQRAVVAQPAYVTVAATNSSRSGHEKKCRLPEPAEIVDIAMATTEVCLWHAVSPGGKGNCSYKLTGTCKRAFHNESGCTFYGHPLYEQYLPQYFVLPDRVQGEIAMTPAEADTLRKPFESCDNRVRFFWTEEPLLHHDNVVGWIGTPEKPLVLMSGGSPGIAQHFYFVLREVGSGDSYRLGWQEPEDMKVIVDIGANIGLFAISACLRFPHARILAFEPHPANFRFLKNNLKEAGCEHRVEAFNKGVSKDGRSLKLYWRDSIGTTAYEQDGRVNHITMQTISPETLLRHVGADDVSLLKIDCEGCEFEVVPRLPKPRIKQMFCEYHQFALNNMSGAAELGKQVAEACAAGNKWGVWINSLRTLAEGHQMKRIMHN